MTSSTALMQLLQGATSKLIDKALWVILATIAAVLIGVTGINFISTHAITIKTTADVRNLIVSGVHEISELTTASTDSKATIVVQQQKRVFGIPVGDTNLIYEGVGTIRTGMDLNKLEVVELDATEHRIHIQLPPPFISEVNLNVNRSSILADYRHWFGSKAGAELYDQAQNKAIAKIKEEACANHILEAANSNAEQLLNTILAKAGFEAIQIDTQPPQPETCSVA